MTKFRCGIYGIFHNPTRKVYIGQATQLENRWSVHRFHLRKGTHHCTHLQNSWNKYGENQFRFKLLEECNTVRLDELEHKWYYTYFPKVFNLQPPGKQARGYKHTETTKKRMSKAAKIFGNTKEQRAIRSARAIEQHRLGKLGRCTWTEQVKHNVSSKAKARSKSRKLLPLIRKLRTKGLSQSDIALKVGLSQVQISKILKEHCADIPKPAFSRSKHTEAAKLAISLASKRMWKQRGKVR